LLNLAFFLLCLLAVRAWALTSHLFPERILVVANSRSLRSVKIAHFYLKARKIPAKNLFLLSLPLKEEVSRPVYLKFIEKPLAEFLKNSGLIDQILAIVLMPDIPHKIKGKVARDGDAASVDSELTLLYRKLLYGPYRLGGWIPNPFFGAPLEIPFEHDRFDIYLVTRIAGYTEKDCLRLIKNALLAPQTRPPYTLVLDARDGPQGPGDNWLHAAYLLLRDFPGLQFQLSFDPAFLVSSKRVIGYASWGSNDPNYPPDRRLFLKFLPGAIGVTYVSTSARTFREPPPGWKVGASWRAKHRHFAGSPQSLIGDLIRLGITGISGNAYEPYLSASARPYLLFPAYLRGKPLAEAYYRSLAYLSWQTVVVGDPLTHLSGSEFRPGNPKPWFYERKKAFLKALQSKDHLLLAQIYLTRLGLEEEALSEIKKLRSQRGLPPQAYPLLFQLSKRKRLHKPLKLLLKDDPSPLGRFLLAAIFWQEKKIKEARQILFPLLEKPSGIQAEALALYGRIMLQEGSCQKAIKCLEKAIALKPPGWPNFPFLYQALKKCGKNRRADHIRRKILSQPELAEWWPRFRN